MSISSLQTIAQTQTARVQTHQDAVVVVCSNPPVNTLSRQVRIDLSHCLEHISQAKPRVVVLLCDGSTFFSGGDISEFSGDPPRPHLPEIVDALEKCQAITVAAAHGNCFGGGFEIAMACDYRIALVGTKFSFPEVKLGLIPGAGGTQRLPRLIGLKNAAEMLASGQVKHTGDMFAMGAIDKVIACSLLETALEFANSCTIKPQKVSERSVANENLDALISRYHFGPRAPLHNIDAAKWTVNKTYSEAQPKERELHLQLRKSTESRALQHLFFAERRAGKPENLKAIGARRLQNVSVIGGGLMGTGIAVACHMAGKTVNIIEHSDSGANQARIRMSDLLNKLAVRGKLAANAEQALAQISVSSDPSHVAGADLLIEAIFEDERAKRELFDALAPHIGRGTIVTTNTSYLNPERIFSPDLHARAAGLHFFSPAHAMKLVEVVKLSGTSLQTLASVFQFSRELKKQPVLSKNCDGFIGNRILAQYRRQADYLLADGATLAEIDAAMREFGMPMGPYELQDRSGLQIAWAHRKHRAAHQEKTERYIPIADRLCESGRFGIKTGSGWYEYENGKRRASDFTSELIENYSASQNIVRKTFSPADIQRRLLSVMYNEANLIVEEGVAQSGADVDVVKIAGYGFPRWLGGPVFYGDHRLDEMKQAMHDVLQQSPASWKTCQKFM